MNKNLFIILGLPLMLSACGAPDSHVGDKIACNVDYIGTYVDYYKEYENKDWSSEEDTKYNITINHKFSVTYPAIYKYADGTETKTALGRDGKEDMIGTFEKTAIVPYTKSGSKFIPDFSQHWSVIQDTDMPEILKVFYALNINDDIDFMTAKSECTIETIVEKK